MLALTLGIWGALFFVILPPVLLWVRLWRHRGARLHAERTQRVYLFLYHSYADEYFYWEPAKMVFVLALVSVRVLGRSLPDTDRMAIYLSLLVIFAMLLTILRPH